MVFTLSLAFSVGRLIPARVTAAGFGFLRSIAKYRGQVSILFV